MDQPSKGFRYSTARRRGRGPSPAVIAAAAVVAFTVVLAVIYRRPPPQITEMLPTSTPLPVATATPAPTQTATPRVELTSGWVTVSSPENTPTPWPTLPVPARRKPTPTPRVFECVNYRWTTIQVFRPSAQVLTEINARNNCNRDLDPQDLMFEITGWRNGDFIQSVRAMPFDRIRHRRSGIISIGLPGSLDWYDEITVEIVE